MVILNNKKYNKNEWYYIKSDNKIENDNEEFSSNNSEFDYLLFDLEKENGLLTYLNHNLVNDYHIYELMKKYENNNFKDNCVWIFNHYEKSESIMIFNITTEIISTKFNKDTLIILLNRKNYDKFELFIKFIDINKFNDEELLNEIKLFHFGEMNKINNYDFNSYKMENDKEYYLECIRLLNKELNKYNAVIGNLLFENKTKMSIDIGIKIEDYYLSLDKLKLTNYTDKQFNFFNTELNLPRKQDRLEKIVESKYLLNHDKIIKSVKEYLNKTICNNSYCIYYFTFYEIRNIK